MVGDNAGNSKTLSTGGGTEGAASIAAATTKNKQPLNPTAPRLNPSANRGRMPRTIIHSPAGPHRQAAHSVGILRLPACNLQWVPERLTLITAVGSWHIGVCCTPAATRRMRCR